MLLFLVSRSLVDIQTCESKEELELLAPNFTATISHFGQVLTVELGQGGEGRTVTMENREEFVHKLYDWMLTGCIADQLQSLRDGFTFLIPLMKLEGFTPYELELILSGQPNIDVSYLQKRTTYFDYRSDSEQVKWMWEVLDEFSEAERAKFLQFATGSGCVPVGVDDWQLRIRRGTSGKDFTV